MNQQENIYCLLLLNKPVFTKFNLKIITDEDFDGKEDIHSLMPEKKSEEKKRERNLISWKKRSFNSKDKALKGNELTPRIFWANPPCQKISSE